MVYLKKRKWNFWSVFLCYYTFCEVCVLYT